LTTEETQEWIAGVVKILSTRENMCAMVLISSDSGLEILSSTPSPVAQFGLLRVVDETVSYRYRALTEESMKSGDVKNKEMQIALEMTDKMDGGIN
jgi:hypothetical protein